GRDLIALVREVERGGECCDQAPAVVECVRESASLLGAHGGPPDPLVGSLPDLVQRLCGPVDRGAVGAHAGWSPWSVGGRRPRWEPSRYPTGYMCIHSSTGRIPRMWGVLAGQRVFITWGVIVDVRGSIPRTSTPADLQRHYRSEHVSTTPVHTDGHSGHTKTPCPPREHGVFGVQPRPLWVS